MTAAITWYYGSSEVTTAGSALPECTISGTPTTTTFTIGGTHEAFSRDDDQYFTMGIGFFTSDTTTVVLRNLWFQLNIVDSGTNLITLLETLPVTPVAGDKVCLIYGAEPKISSKEILQGCSQIMPNTCFFSSYGYNTGYIIAKNTSGGELVDFEPVSKTTEYPLDVYYALPDEDDKYTNYVTGPQTLAEDETMMVLVMTAGVAATPYRKITATIGETTVGSGAIGYDDVEIIYNTKVETEGYSIVARDTSTGVESVLGFIPTGSTTLTDIPLSVGTYEIEARGSHNFWDESHSKKKTTLQIISPTSYQQGLPDINNLASVIKNLYTTITWSIPSEYSGDSYSIGVWFGATSPVTVDDPPDIKLAGGLGTYTINRQQTASEYIAVASYRGAGSDFENGNVSELSLTYDATKPDEPANQEAE